MGGTDRPLGPAEEMGAGVVAGVTSALVGSPLELVMIQQQRKGGGTVATVKSIAAPAHFYRGFVGAAVREGLWTCGYLSIPPIVRRQLRERYPEKFDSDAKARVPAALLGGLFACYLTQVSRRGGLLCPAATASFSAVACLLCQAVVASIAAARKPLHQSTAIMSPTA